MASELAYLEKVRRGETPNPDEALAFLRAWHARHPGATGKVVQVGRASDPIGSYARLASLVREDHDLCVVDLACGDGPLTRELATQLGAHARILGIDASEEDLALARAHFAGDPRVSFRCELAQRTSLATGSASAVLCHYALMLMNPLAPVVSEIARVLAPGGLFAAVVPDRWSAASVSAALGALIEDVRARDLPAFPQLGLADPALASRGFAYFFEQTGTFAATVEVERFATDTALTTQDTWTWITKTYWFDMLTDGGRARLETEGRAIIDSACGEDGLVHARRELSLLTCRRARAGEEGKGVRFKRRSPADPDARALLEQYVEELAARWNVQLDLAEVLEPSSLSSPRGELLVLYADGRPIACGGVRALGTTRHAWETCEVKRMFVAPSARRLGYARKLLAALEDSGRARGAMRVVLDTDEDDREAIALYESSGYRRVAKYNENESASAWFAKELGGENGRP